MTKIQLQQIMQALEALHIKLKQDIEQGTEASKPVELDQQAFGRVSRIDAIQQQQMQLSAVNRMKQRLIAVERAIKLAGKEEFGLCSVCEEPINFERLKVRPEASLCIACAKSSKG